MFIQSYKKTFITGNLKGITVPVSYQIAEPQRYVVHDGDILVDCITKDQSIVSDASIRPAKLS